MEKKKKLKRTVNYCYDEILIKIQKLGIHLNQAKNIALIMQVKHQLSSNYYLLS